VVGTDPARSTPPVTTWSRSGAPGAPPAPYRRALHPYAENGTVYAMDASPFPEIPAWMTDHPYEPGDTPGLCARCGYGQDFPWHQGYWAAHPESPSPVADETDDA
jgi:hypothetical protein